MYKFATALLTFLVALSPLPFGSAQPWFEAPVYALIFCIGIFLLIISNKKENQFESPPFLIPFFVIFFFLLLAQMIPLPPSLLKFISPNTYDQYFNISGESGWYPVSLYPYATRMEVCRLAGALVLYLIFSRIEDKKTLHLIILTFIGFSFFEAAYGLFELWSGRLHIFGYKKILETTSAYGTFINRNHYAAILNLGLFLSLGFFLEKIRKLQQVKVTLGRTLIAFLNEKNILYLLVFFNSILLTVALFYSRSKGGMLSFCLGVVIFLILAFIKHPGVLRKWILSIFIFLSLLVIFGIYKANWKSVITERYQKSALQSAYQDRLNIWKDSMQIWRDYPVLGVGGGVFGEAFPSYKNISDFPEEKRLRHAHNEYLEILCDYGLLGIVVLVISGIFFLWKIRKAYNFIFLGLLISLFCFSLHSFVEFNLRIPSLFLWFFTFLGLLEAIVKKGRSIL